MSRFTKIRKQNRIQQAETKKRGDELSDKLKNISDNPTEFIKNQWHNIYKLPLHKDDYGDYIWTKDNEMAMSIFREEWETDDEIIQKIVDIINGDIVSDFDPEWTANGCDVHYKGEYAFCVRGWGLLTGTLKLNNEVAELIQDGFVEYIINRLNGK